jgi:transcriptional regulator with XRE-family HTH domain
MGFKETVRRLRQEAGLSQAALAAKAGVPIRSIQNYEQGHRVPKATALLAISRAVGVSLDALVGELVADDKTPSVAQEPGSASKAAPAAEGKAKGTRGGR